MAFIRFILRWLLVYATFCLQTTSASYPFSEELGKGAFLQWNYDQHNITLKLTAPTLGWIGIGFSKTGTMERADVILMTYSGGECYIWDAYAARNGYPDIDRSQNVEMVQCGENGTHTSATIQRRLTSADDKDNDITKGLNNVIWAYGISDKSQERVASDYHKTNRGSHSMVLLRSKDVQTGNTDISESVPPAADLVTGAEVDTVDDNAVELIYSAHLDFDNTVQLRWNYDDERIIMQLVAPTRGWIGVGLSQTSSMAGADLIIMGVDGNRTYAVDAYATKNGVPSVDASQDVRILSGYENDTHTIVTVIRQRVTCDENDKKIDEGTYRMIWAYGTSDLSDGGPSGSSYHGQKRGSKSLKLLNPVQVNDAKRRPDDESIKFFDIRPVNFSVPAEDTYYYCKAFKLPENTKHHIIEFEPFLTPGNEKHIHHVLIMLCQRPVKQSLLDTSGRCFEDIDTFVIGCIEIIIGWTIGMSKFAYPAEAGFPFGASDRERYVVMQMHYDNPDLKEFIDSSGVRIWYTNKLRKFDIGLLSVQRDITSMWIPPGAEKFRVQSYCSRGCLRHGFRRLRRPKEVSVIGVVLHSHLVGRSMRLRHFRNRTEIEPLAYDDFYDFNYQEAQYKTNTKLKPGDSLLLQCDYGTLRRQHVTAGGLGTRQEMCSAFIIYYPKMSLDICDSSTTLLDTQSLLSLAVTLNITLDAEDLSNLFIALRKDYYSIMGLIGSYLDRADWTPQNIKLAEEFTNSLPYHPICTHRSNWLMNYRETMRIPRNKPYEEEDTCVGGERKSSENILR